MNYFGSARRALAALPDLARPRGSARPMRIGSENEARAELAASQKFGVSLLAPEEAGYPPRLTAIDDAPPLLGVRGALETLMRPMIAVVGSRNASAGLKFAGRRRGRMSGAPPAFVRTVLLKLELAGRLERHGGGLVSMI